MGVDVGVILRRVCAQATPAPDFDKYASEPLFMELVPAAVWFDSHRLTLSKHASTLHHSQSNASEVNQLHLTPSTTHML